jgi:perosamine synthetase
MFYRQLPARSPIPAGALPRLTLETLGYGPDPREKLERLLLERYGANGCSLYASGTHALQVALEVTRRASKMPVLLPAYTCYEVATAAVGAGIPVALYDVDANTLEPDWNSVQTAAAGGAAALVVAPLFGMPLDWNAAQRAAQRVGALLIADVAQAFGTTWQGRPAGAVADLTILSFGRGKGWTGAGGGALLWRTAQHEARQFDVVPARNGHRPIAEAKSAARAGSQWLLGRRNVYGLPSAIPFLKLGETVYHEPTSPARMTRASASLLLSSADEAVLEVSRRRGHASDYAGWLDQPAPSVTAVVGARMNDESGALRFPIRIRGGWAGLQHSPAPRLGAAPGYPTTIREIGAVRPLIVNPSAQLPQSELLVRELVTLPTHSQMSWVERRRLAELICGYHATIN